MSELFLKSVNMSISASWLILAVMMLRLILKRAPKWVNVLLWGIVAIRLICPFSFESALSLVPSAETISENVISGSSLDVQTGITPVDSRINDYLEDRYFEGVTATASNDSSVMNTLAIVWLIGILLLAVYTVISYIRLNGRVATAIRFKDNIFRSENVCSPFVLGMVKPRIYLPLNMNGGEAEHVIAHERAHISRGDHWWKPLGFLLLTIYWFNPLMWLGYVLLCRDIELACDERVIKELSREQRADYSQALVTCSVSRRVLAACPIAFGEVGVKARVKSVMKYKKPKIWMIVAAVIICIAMAVCFLTDPIKIGDYFMLTDDGADSRSNRLSYDIKLGTSALGGEVYVEQWHDGECIKSAPVVITEQIRSIDITMSERREDGKFTGTDIQIDTDPYNGSLLTYFEHPKEDKVLGWSFTGYEMNKKVSLSPNKDVILAAMAFDMGNGVRSYSCDVLADEPERLQNADQMIVVRAVFSEDQIPVMDHAELPTEQLSMKTVIELSERGQDLTWEDFERYEYTDIGSGLYIRQYRIDERYELLIGGGDLDSEPMYIYLIREGDERIDIRDSDVAEFISEQTTPPSDSGAMIPMVMVNGVIYMDTGFESTIDGRCGVMDGTIVSQVSGREKPTENDQSNFGVDYGYQYGVSEGTIEINIDGEWRIFATEEVRKEMQLPPETN